MSSINIKFIFMNQKYQLIPVYIIYMGFFKGKQGQKKNTKVLCNLYYGSEKKNINNGKKTNNRLK